MNSVDHYLLRSVIEATTPRREPGNQVNLIDSMMIPQFGFPWQRVILGGSSANPEGTQPTDEDAHGRPPTDQLADRFRNLRDLGQSLEMMTDTLLSGNLAGAENLIPNIRNSLQERLRATNFNMDGRELAATFELLQTAQDVLATVETHLETARRIPTPSTPDGSHLRPRAARPSRAAEGSDDEGEAGIPSLQSISASSDEGYTSSEDESEDGFGGAPWRHGLGESYQPFLVDTNVEETVDTRPTPQSTHNRPQAGPAGSASEERPNGSLSTEIFSSGRSSIEFTLTRTTRTTVEEAVLREPRNVDEVQVEAAEGVGEALAEGPSATVLVPEPPFLTDGRGRVVWSSPRSGSEEGEAPISVTPRLATSLVSATVLPGPSVVGSSSTPNSTLPPPTAPASNKPSTVETPRGTMLSVSAPAFVPRSFLQGGEGLSTPQLSLDDLD